MKRGHSTIGSATYCLLLVLLLWAKPLEAMPNEVRRSTCYADTLREERISSNQVIAPQGDQPRGWLALRSNLLADLAITPNLGLEAFMGRHWSLELSGYWAWWAKPEANFFWRIQGVESELKYWLGHSSRRGVGHHLGLYGQLFDYDFQLGGEGVLGDRLHCGVGLAYGYAFPIGRHWTLEGTLGVGYVYGIFKQYGKYSDGCFPWKATKRLDFVGPTKVALSLVYRLW